jgi:hypothetical protein
MGKKQNRLSARTVATAKPGHYHDGQGLYLHVSKNGSRKFSYRFTTPDTDRVTEMGLGPARARDRAHEARKLVATGINSITARREGRQRKANTRTFGQCSEALIESKRSGWRSAIHAAQWSASLATYCRPLWDTPVDEIDTAAVLGVLKPIWNRIPETASRVRARIEAVLDFAKVHKWRSGPGGASLENPAVWKGNLVSILPKQQRLARYHFPAMSYQDVPGFVGKLRGRPSMAAMARTKSGREHRVPLSDSALTILERLAVGSAPLEFVFPGQRRGRPLSGIAMTLVLKRMKVKNATAHGSRSSFSDWAAECTTVQREIVEGCLAHVVGSAVARAYRRTDVLEKRRGVLEAWALFINGELALEPSPNGIPLKVDSRNMAIVMTAADHAGDRCNCSTA